MSAARGAFAAVALTIGAFVALGFHAIGATSPTLDEPGHYRYGHRILRGVAARFDDSKMPVSALNALPCRIAEAQGGRAEAELDGPCDWVLARTPTVLLGAALAAFAAFWANRLYGPAGGVAAAALVGFDPTFIGHSALVTTDVAAALSVVVTLFAASRWFERPSSIRAALAGLAFGAALSTKYTATYLVLIVPAAAAFRWIGRPEERPGARTIATGAVLVVTAALAVVNGAFLFDGSGSSLREIHFESAAFRGLRSAPMVGAAPLPVPRPFVEGLDRVWHRERDGGGSGNIYFLGELRPPGSAGFKTYYLVLSLVKLPISALVVLAVAAGLAWRARDRLSIDEWMLLSAAGFFVLYFNLVYRAQIGQRFFLVALAPAFVLAGRFGSWAVESGRTGTAVAAALLIAQAGAALGASPRFISYFNPLVAAHDVWKVAADSNVDWNQTNADIEAWLAAHPDVRPAPAKPTAGRILVGVNQLTGVVTRRRMAWLRASGLEPVAVVAGTHFLFDVPENLAAELLVRFPRPNTPDPDE